MAFKGIICTTEGGDWLLEGYIPALVIFLCCFTSQLCAQAVSVWAELHSTFGVQYIHIDMNINNKTHQDLKRKFCLYAFGKMRVIASS